MDLSENFGTRVEVKPLLYPGESITVLPEARETVMMRDLQTLSPWRSLGRGKPAKRLSEALQKELGEGFFG